jgi:FAD/FMN-containing dehydrogenase
MPAVVPQLKTITLGGAVSGIGIESSSFRYGLVHETVLSMEVLTGSGEVLIATPTNQHQDLFFAFPNSYGTLGYCLSLTIKLVRVKPYVKTTYLKYKQPKALFKDLKSICDTGKWQGQKVDFVDGMLFKKGEYYICLGQMVAQAPYQSDYTYRRIFYKSIRQREHDYLSIHDYIWRWDTDWFWCSQALGAQNPLLRTIYGRNRLNSRFYMKLYQLDKKIPVMSVVNKLRRQPAREEMVQDVELPIQNCRAFVDFYYQIIKITPTWICPVRQLDDKRHWTLFDMKPAQLYVNFGFWNSVLANPREPEGYFNKKLEAEVTLLKGKKSLYSRAFYSEKVFNSLYNRRAYDILKSKYDPKGSLKDYYQKTVNRG